MRLVAKRAIRNKAIVLGRWKSDFRKQKQTSQRDLRVRELAREYDALILATEWPEFTSPSWERVMALLGGQVLYDGRNLWDPAELRGMGFRYRGIGRR